MPKAAKDDICPYCGSGPIKRERRPDGHTQCLACGVRKTHVVWNARVKVVEDDVERLARRLEGTPEPVPAPIDWGLVGKDIALAAGRALPVELPVAWTIDASAPELSPTSKGRHIRFSLLHLNDGLWERIQGTPAVVWVVAEGSLRGFLMVSPHPGVLYERVVDDLDAAQVADRLVELFEPTLLRWVASLR